jgi:hypothetical protein
MSETMVNMVTTQLLNIEEVFRRLDPNTVAHILSPEVPKMMESIGNDMTPVGWLPRLSKSLFFSLPIKTISTMSSMNHKFLHDFTVAMQDNIGALLNVKNCVIDQMMQDRALLGQLFRKCGQKELDFLTNSGLWFGFGANPNGSSAFLGKSLGKSNWRYYCGPCNELARSEMDI